MSDYWLGVLTIPAVGVALIAAYVLARGLLWVAGRISVTLVHIAGHGLSKDKKALFAATTYAAKKGWALGLGDFGLIVLVGQDIEARSAAYDRVRERTKMPWDDDA